MGRGRWRAGGLGLDMEEGVVSMGRWNDCLRRFVSFAICLVDTLVEIRN